jgi:hypothetical protein
MTTPELHPWLSHPEALTAAHRAVSIPMGMMGGHARIIGADELVSEALAILTECALPPIDEMPTACAVCGGSLDLVRAGAKFCSDNCRKKHEVWVQRGKVFAIPPTTRGHIGSMHSWPEDQMLSYAIREVGYVLNNYIRTRTHILETPASEYLAMYAVAQ